MSLNFEQTCRSWFSLVRMDPVATDDELRWADMSMMQIKPITTMVADTTFTPTPVTVSIPGHKKLLKLPHYRIIPICQIARVYWMKMPIEVQQQGKEISRKFCNNNFTKFSCFSPWVLRIYFFSFFESLPSGCRRPLYSSFFTVPPLQFPNGISFSRTHL